MRGPRSAPRFFVWALVLVSFALAAAACRTAKTALSFDAPQAGPAPGKLPLTAGLIIDESITTWTWLPDDPAIQWNVPKQLHPGRLLQEISERSLAFVFEGVVSAPTAQEAWKLGADLLLRFENKLNATRVPAELKAEMKILVYGVDGKLLQTFFEQGQSSHTWSPLDDGAIHNAFISVYERLIPRMAADRGLRDYVQEMPRILERMRTPPPRPAAPPAPAPQNRSARAPAPVVDILAVRLAVAGDLDRAVNRVRPGQSLEMAVTYVVSGAGPGESVDLSEVRAVMLAGNVLVESRDLSQQRNGTHTTSKTLTLPAAAPAGSYVLRATIRAGGKSVSKSFEFDIE